MIVAVAIYIGITTCSLSNAYRPIRRIVGAVSAKDTCINLAES